MAQKAETRQQRDHDSSAAGRPRRQPSNLSSLHPEAAVSSPGVHIAPASLTPADVLRLQRTIGNRATGALLQAKLKLGAANDRYEREADQVAQQVTRQLQSPPVRRDDLEEDELAQAKPRAENITPVRRTFVASPSTLQRDDLEEDDEIQAKPLHGPEGGDVDADVARAIQSAKGRGRPLDEGLRRSMEQGFGADFSRVRVHTGPRADALNRSLNARAFTTGNHIFFASGQYNPGSSGGQKLIAHELTHTVQQGAVPVVQSQAQPARCCSSTWPGGSAWTPRRTGPWAKGTVSAVQGAAEFDRPCLGKTASC